MKVIYLLLHFNLFNYAVSFVVLKTKIYHPVPPEIVNLEPQSSNQATGDIKFTILANNHGDEVANIGNLIKSIKVPGYNVYRIVLNRDDNRNNENADPSTKLSQLPVKLNHTEKRLSNAIEKENVTNTLNIKEINKAPYTETVINQQLTMKNCDGKNSIDKNECEEETTTSINEVTTDIDDSIGNSTVTSEYDDENYGSLSDRSDIPPGLLASLVG